MMVALSSSSARGPPDELAPRDGAILSNRFVDPYSVVFIKLLHKSEDLAPHFAGERNEAFKLERKTFHGQ
jgi:hypothetical protein